MVKLQSLFPPKRKISDLLHALGLLCSASVKAPLKTQGHNRNTRLGYYQLLPLTRLLDSDPYQQHHAVVVIPAIPALLPAILAILEIHRLTSLSRKKYTHCCWFTGRQFGAISRQKFYLPFSVTLVQCPLSNCAVAELCQHDNWLNCHQRDSYYQLNSRTRLIYRGGPKVDNIGDSGVKLKVYIMICYCLGNFRMNFDHFVASLGSL